MHISVPLERFPPLETTIKIAVAAAIGLFVGLEREWSNKDIGVRTFGLASLLGMLSALAGPGYPLLAVAASLVLVGFVNWRSAKVDGSLEITTSVALVLTVVLGALVGQGHLFTPVATAIIMTMLLAWKMELHRFAGALTTDEIRSAVLLGLLGFVIYPVLPNEFIDRWQLINPRETWITIVIVALVGFVNYALLRIYSSKGLYYTAVLGGLVNSTATVAELSTSLNSQPGMPAATAGILLLTIMAMFFRNLLLLAFFSPQALKYAAIPLLVMGAASAVVVWWKSAGSRDASAPIVLGSPVSLRRVFKFGVFFIIVAAAGTLAQRHLGKLGFLFVSGVGGLVSSASTTAAAANLVEHGTLAASFGGFAAVVTSITSALINLPIVYRQNQDRKAFRILLVASSVVVLLGIAALFAVSVAVTG